MSYLSVSDRAVGERDAWGFPLRLAVLAALALATLGALAGQAQAAAQVDSMFGSFSGEPALGGTFNQPGGVAVRQSTGQVYVFDRNNSRIQRFSSTGDFQLAWGWDVVQGGGTAFEICTNAADCKAGEAGTGGGQISSTIAAQGVAVDQSTGAVYITSGRRIQKFDADGNFLRAWGRDVVDSGPGNVGGFEICVPANGDVCKGGEIGSLAGEFAAGAHTIAVDSAGAVLAGEGTNRRVQKFTADGTPLLAFGWDVVASGPGNVGAGSEQQLITKTVVSGTFTLTFEGETTAPIPFNADAATVQNALVALPTIGQTPTNLPNVTVTGANGGPWTATFANDLARTDVSQITGTGATTSTVSDGAAYEVCVAADSDVCQAGASGNNRPGKFLTGASLFVATDSSNRVYASDTDGGRVQRFQSNGTSPEVFGASELSSVAAPPRQITVDSTDDHVYVVKDSPVDGERQIKEMLPDGTLAPDGLHGEGAGMTSSNGLAMLETPDASTGRLYVTSTQVRHWVVVLDDDGGVTGSTPTIAPASDIGTDSAQLNGTVNPNGFETSYRFEYSLNGNDWTPVGSFQSVGSGMSAVPVSVVVNGLQANAMYQARIVVDTVFAGISWSAAISFQTLAPPGPGVVTGAAQNVTANSASVRGRINPNNSLTTYHVEYGTTIAYGETAPADIVPGNAGAGGVEQLFVVQLSDLDPNQTYHYRFVATNTQGTTEGADRTFTTRSGVTPPAGRAYEMVTPPDKSGRVGGQDTRVDSPLVGIPSADGESLLSATKWFLMDAEASGSIPHSFNPLLIERTATGWQGQALNNVAPDQPSIAGLTNPSGLSPDLGVQAWQHNEWLFPSGSPLGTRVFGDAGGTIPGSGWYDWLGAPAGKAVGAINSDSALLTEGGADMVRWGGPLATYRGLLGSTVGQDPSNSQLAGSAGGDAIYKQSPAATGPLDLVNECTGAGAGATQIPMVDDNGTAGVPGDDVVDSQDCSAGEVTSPRGATVGGGPVLAPPTPVMGPVRRALSEDGNRVVFASPDPHATGVPTSCGSTTGASTACPPQLFVRQYDSSGDPTVRWISRSEVDGQAPDLFGRGVAYEGASADGSVVYFKTNAPLTADDPNGTGTPGPKTTGTASDDSWDLYRYELPGDNDVDPAGGELTRVSGGPDGPDGDSAPGDFDPNVLELNPLDISRGAAGALRFLSDDGSKAYFTTRGIIGSPGDPWNAAPANGSTGPAGTNLATERNLYLFDAEKPVSEQWKFIAQIPISPSGIDSCASLHARSGMPQNASDDAQPQDPSIPSLGRGSTNCVHGLSSGEAIVFETRAQLTGDDEDAAGDIYMYDAEGDELIRVSAPPSDESSYLCDANNAGGNCNATLGRQHILADNHEFVGLNGAQNQNVAVDDDGAISVFFESRVPLVSADSSGSSMDVYEWRAGEVSLISPAGDDEGAYFSGNTPDRQDVFFATAEPIDPREIDADFDVYDARIGGGFPLPPAPPAPCNPLTDACQAAGGGTPTTGGRETDKPGGGGNASPGPRVSLSVARPGSRALRRAGRSGVLVLKVGSSAPGRVSVTAKAKIKGKSRSVATASKQLASAGSVKVRLRLSRAARTQLRKKGTLRLSLVVRKPDARSRSLTLRIVRGSR